MIRVLALDIGGANLKAAHSGGVARSDPFAVWRRPSELGQATAELIGRMPPFDIVAVTMTAELCDCFPTKADGVNAVLNAVEAAVSGLGRPAPVGVWLIDGRLVSPRDARAEPLLAAASNWLALATWAGRHCPEGPALLIDVGSTTTDIVPLRDGAPTPRGRTDLDRLVSRELRYSGVMRTPVCALVRQVEVRGRLCGVATEWFATTRDVYLRSSDLPERPDDTDTADGRPATRVHAAARLARVVCADSTMLSEHEVDAIAEQVARAQAMQLELAGLTVQSRLGEPVRTYVLAGAGEFLARRVAETLRTDGARIISLRDLLGPDISAAACAYALAVLAAERIGGRQSAAGEEPSPVSRGQTQCRVSQSPEARPHAVLSTAVLSTDPARLPTGPTEDRPNGTQYSVLSTDPARHTESPSAVHQASTAAPAAPLTTHNSPLASCHPPLAPDPSVRTIVVKLGGSLLDLNDLATRLRGFLATLGDARVLLVVGGGTAADLVRLRDQFDHLGDDPSHWLAVRAMSFNGFLVEALLPNSAVVPSLAQCRSAWEAGRVPILDAHTFLTSEDAADRRLPHTWSVTSDTIAAHVARLVDADGLVLLKSVAWPNGDLAEAARRGIVDEFLPHEVRDARLSVRIENLRTFRDKVQSRHD
jgi:probable H4MPT-linked C1 transfer pathway protein